MKGLIVMVSAVVLAIGLVFGSPLPACAKDVPAVSIGDPGNRLGLTCVSCPDDARESALRIRHRSAAAPLASPREIWRLMRFYSVLWGQPW